MGMVLPCWPPLSSTCCPVKDPLPPEILPAPHPLFGVAFLGAICLTAMLKAYSPSMSSKRTDILSLLLDESPDIWSKVMERIRLRDLKGLEWCEMHEKWLSYNCDTTHLNFESGSLLLLLQSPEPLGKSRNLRTAYNFRASVVAEPGTSRDYPGTSWLHAISELCRLIQLSIEFYHNVSRSKA
jgi:hypothetical protein